MHAAFETARRHAFERRVAIARRLHDEQMIDVPAVAVFLRQDEPASGKAATIEAGAVALVAFVADAPTAAVLELLAAHQMSIVHGPDAAGAVTVRLGSATMSETERQEKIAALKSRHDLVALVFTLR